MEKAPESKDDGGARLFSTDPPPAVAAAAASYLATCGPLCIVEPASAANNCMPLNLFSAAPKKQTSNPYFRRVIHASQKHPKNDFWCTEMKGEYVCAFCAEPIMGLPYPMIEDYREQTGEAFTGSIQCNLVCTKSHIVALKGNEMNQRLEWLTIVAAEAYGWTDDIPVIDKLMLDKFYYGTQKHSDYIRGVALMPRPRLRNLPFVPQKTCIEDEFEDLVRLAAPLDQIHAEAAASAANAPPPVKVVRKRKAPAPAAPKPPPAAPSVPAEPKAPKPRAKKPSAPKKPKKPETEAAALALVAAAGDIPDAPSEKPKSKAKSKAKPKAQGPEPTVAVVVGPLSPNQHEAPVTATVVATVSQPPPRQQQQQQQKRAKPDKRPAAAAPSSEPAKPPVDVLLFDTVPSAVCAEPALVPPPAPAQTKVAPEHKPKAKTKTKAKQKAKAKARPPADEDSGSEDSDEDSGEEEEEDAPPPKKRIKTKSKAPVASKKTKTKKRKRDELEGKGRTGPRVAPNPALSALAGNSGDFVRGLEDLMSISVEQ